MLNHYFILRISALFTKEHYVLAHYKNKCISLCFLKDPWKSIGALLLFCCGGVHLKMQIRADQSEALKPEPCQPIRSSKTWATLSAVIPSYTEPPITSYFSDWSSFLYNLFGTNPFSAISPAPDERVKRDTCPRRNRLLIAFPGNSICGEMGRQMAH